MPEQLMLPTLKPDSYAAFARRFALSASLSAIVVCCGASVSAQSAAKPARPAKVSSPPATTPVRTGKVKANDAAEKPAAGMPTEKPTATTMQNPTGTAEITRARRANAPAAAAAATSPAPVEATAATGAASVETDAKATEAELDKLRADIKAASATAERARLQRALVERLTELDRNADALTELRLMLQEDRYDPAFFFNTGNALVRLGDASAAAEAYRKAISQRRGNYARALNNLGVVLIRQGNWDEAQQTLTAALVQENYSLCGSELQPRSSHLLRGEADLAIREWRRTLHLEPAHAEATVALARAYTEDGDAKRALAVLDNFIARSARSGASVPREIADVRRELVDAANVRNGRRQYCSRRRWSPLFVKLKTASARS
jgi:Tfp pilus assembly protein PilF